MKHSSIFARITAKLTTKINSEEYMKKAKRNEKDFSRNRKLSFVDYIVLLLRCSKRSLQSGLNEFCREAKACKTEYSKQAFSQGRDRIRPEAIKELFEETVTEFYNVAEYKTLKGYRISAIDGTDYNLPCNEQLLEEFGSENYAGNVVRVQALGSCLYDVLNHYLIDASIGRFNENERIHAKAHLEKLIKIRTPKELVLFDRGYPSEELICFLEENNIKYLMRCTKDNFFKEIRDFSGTDGIVMRPIDRENGLKIRVLCCENGNTFITNLGSDEFSSEEIYDLYHKRWTIETKYNDIKNKMVIENFSGVSKTAVYQDFWASMTLSNLMSALEFDASLELERKKVKKTNIRDRKINRATLINSLKDEFISIFSQSSIKKRNKIISRIINEISKSLIDIVPDRHFSRKLSPRAKRFLPNSKSLS